MSVLVDLNHALIPDQIDRSVHGSQSSASLEGGLYTLMRFPRLSPLVYVRSDGVNYTATYDVESHFVATRSAPIPL